jgi:hypothetical protein
MISIPLAILLGQSCYITTHLKTRQLGEELVGRNVNCMLIFADVGDICLTFGPSNLYTKPKFENDGHLLLYTLSHIEPSGNAPVRPGYNELTLQRATAACHVQCPNSNSLMKTCIKTLQVYGVI